ncbi:MAG: hypothetical protein K6G60_02870 [Lachnospiraceae bacterium]|nr:hypothetical protein [Lachnospiraceae bacterium]
MYPFGFPFFESTNRTRVNNLRLLLEANDNIPQDLIDELRQDETEYKVIFTTTKKTIVPDRKYPGCVGSIKNVKMIFKIDSGGILILSGSLQNYFKPPFCGGFYATKYTVDDASNFDSIKGVKATVSFPTLYNNMTEIETMRVFMKDLSEDSDFEFNISQFDEFMDVFEFYKQISGELNNNFSYKVSNISERYYFLPLDVADFESEFKQEVYDNQGVLKGYRFLESDYEPLKNEIKEQVQVLIDVSIKGGDDEFRRILRAGAECLFLSDTETITEQNVKLIKQFQIVNAVIDRDEVIISGEMKYEADYEHKGHF